jgi:hypothetical protein
VRSPFNKIAQLVIITTGARIKLMARMIASIVMRAIAPGIMGHQTLFRAIKSQPFEDLQLFMIHHPRWECVYQPKFAAYLNLIKPWWKVLCSLALKGRRFETWEVVAAVEAATAYWNAHKHPFVWGRRRRHQPHRPSSSFSFQVKVLHI